MKMHNIAFTGHRKIEWAHMVDIHKGIGKLRTRGAGELLTFHSGGAAGFDTIMFKGLMYHPDAINVLHIPFEYQWLELQQRVGMDGMSITEYASWCPLCPSGMDRPLATADNRFYQIRNEHMVDSADEVICYWDGAEKSGTWNTIKYARKTGKPVRDIREL